MVPTDGLSKYCPKNLQRMRYCPIGDTTHIGFCQNMLHTFYKITSNFCIIVKASIILWKGWEVGWREVWFQTSGATGDGWYRSGLNQLMDKQAWGEMLYLAPDSYTKFQSRYRKICIQCFLVNVKFKKLRTEMFYNLASRLSLGCYISHLYLFVCNVISKPIYSKEPWNSEC